MKKFCCVILALFIILTGCSKDSEETLADNEPKYQEDPSVHIEKEEVLLFVYTDMTKGLGDLYLQKGATDKEKIASNVLKQQFGYLYHAKVALYIDMDHNLYMKEPGKPSEQLSTDVYAESLVASKDETTILFLKSAKANDFSSTHGDLYRMVRGSEKEKLASEVNLSDYQLSDDGKITTFVTRDGALYRKADDVTDKEKIGSDVVDHFTSPDGKVSVYQNKESDVYLKNASAIDKEKLSSEYVGNVKYTLDSKTAAYLDEYREDSEKGELMLLREGYEKIKLASDVKEFDFTALGDYIYFLNEDKTLYAKVLSDAEETVAKKEKDKEEPSAAPAALKTLNPAEKVKIADDILSFSVSPDGTSIIFLDSDNNLFIQRTGEEKARVASDISEAHVYNRTILMLNKEKTLFTLDLTLDEAEEGEDVKSQENKKNNQSEDTAESKPALLPASPLKDKVKLAENVEKYFSDSSLSYIAFKTTGNEIFLKTKAQAEAVRVIEKLDAYHSIHFMGEMLYEKLVTLDQIVGSWHATSEYEGETFDWYEEITTEMKHISYNLGPDDSERTFELMNPTPSMIDLVFTKDSDDMISLEVVDKDTLKVYYNYEDPESFATLKRVAKEELKKEVAAQKEAYRIEQEHQAMMDEAQGIADSMLYSYLYNTNENVSVYSDPSTGDVVGTLGTYMELYVTDTYVTDSGEVWCKSTVYFSDIYSYEDVWYTYNSVI